MINEERNMSVRQPCLSIIFLFFSYTSAQAATTTVVVDGKLVGFDDVVVGTETYNVRFIYGSFNSIFNDGADLDFNTAFDAGVAAEALLNAYDMFPTYDDDPGLTTGVSTATGRIWTPYNFLDRDLPNDTATSRVYKNTSGTNLNPDAIETSTVVRTADKLYADWEQVAIVPIPAALWLFGSGLLGLLGVARRKKAYD
jgi:hypothetical protein